jgi:hypothetical protein
MNQFLLPNGLCRDCRDIRKAKRPDRRRGCSDRTAKKRSRSRERRARHCAVFVSLWRCRVEGKGGRIRPREELGNNRQPSHESRLELGLCLSD